MSRPIISSTDALRAPDWRYRRALDLRKSGRPASRTHDDRRIHALCYLLRKRAESGRCTGVRSELSATAAAVDVYENRQSICPALEAHLLSGATGPQIAARFGLAPAAIDAYHDCCFDIRDRLKRVEYIVRNVILADVSPRSASHGAQTAIKFIAYLGGPSALERVSAAPVAGDGAVTDPLARMTGATETLVGVLQHLLLLQDGDAASSIARASLEQSIRRRAAEPQSESLNQYEQNVDAVLKSLKFGCGRPNPENYPPSARPFLYSTVELRAHDMQTLMNGGQLENAEELLAQTFPPPRRPEDAGPGSEVNG
jgi:hypothetical protein